MPYVDPIEAALRALTGVDWTKRKDCFEARVNKTTLVAIEQELSDYKIAVICEPSQAQTGRYIAKVMNSELPFIQYAIKKTGTEVKPNRRKSRS